MKRKHLSQFNSLIKKKKFFLIEPFLKTTTAETCKGEFVLVHLAQANVTICICEKRGNKNKPAAAMNGNGEHWRIQIFNKRRILTLAHFLSMAQNLFFNAKIDYSAIADEWAIALCSNPGAVRNSVVNRGLPVQQYHIDYRSRLNQKKKKRSISYSFRCMLCLPPSCYGRFWCEEKRKRRATVEDLHKWKHRVETFFS